MLWIELTTLGGQTIWVNLATYRIMQRFDRDKGEPVTHLIGLANNAEGQPEVTTVRETPEEILKIAGLSKKTGNPAGVGFIRRGTQED